MDLPQIRFLHKILLSGPQRIDQKESHGKELWDSIKPLVRMNILNDFGGDRLGFAAPILKRFLYFDIFPGRTYLEAIPADIDTLIVEAIKRMDPLGLEQTVSDEIADDLKDLPMPKEAALQHYFTWALVRCIGANVKLIPEMSSSVVTASGRVKRGSLDFYIDSNVNWGIELVRDGSKLQQDVERFGVEGAYSGLRLAAWRIVDFRYESSPIKFDLSKVRNLIAVSFDKDFRRAELKGYLKPTGPNPAPDFRELVQMEKSPTRNVVQSMPFGSTPVVGDVRRGGNGWRAV